ncbi:MAG: hypothetical protein RL215_776 [Planctomycetota bacterium]
MLVVVAELVVKAVFVFGELSADIFGEQITAPLSIVFGLAAPLVRGGCLSGVDGQ